MRRWVVALGLLLASCADDDKIVFRDREFFNPPPDSTSGFLGYYDAETKLTTCGNCHVEKQSEWETTAHADAHASLVASGHSQSDCFKCHTVSQQGNEVVGAAGWDVVADAAYHGVQCESHRESSRPRRDCSGLS